MSRKEFSSSFEEERNGIISLCELIVIIVMSVSIILVMMMMMIMAIVMMINERIRHNLAIK